MGFKIVPDLVQTILSLRTSTDCWSECKKTSYECLIIHLRTECQNVPGCILCYDSNFNCLKLTQHAPPSLRLAGEQTFFMMIVRQQTK